jgi:hypothetical protein
MQRRHQILVLDTALSELRTAPGQMKLRSSNVDELDNLRGHRSMLGNEVGGEASGG